MHLTDDQLNEYLDHETHDRTLIEAHLSSCMDCAARLSTLEELFSEIESLPELKLTRPIALRLPPSPSLPRSLTLTATLQAALALVTIIVAAPFVMQFSSPYLVNVPAPSLTDVLIQFQAQWMLWLDILSKFQMPTIPEVPVVEISSLFMMLTVIGVSLLWLIGNGLLLRNK